MDASSLYRGLREGGNETKIYQALLIGQWGNPYYKEESSQKESLRELSLLCDTAGVQNQHELFLKIQSIDPSFFFHKGNLIRIKELISTNDINLLVIDAALKANQLRNLEEELKTRVIGRIELILDIFAMRARTKASSLQVELAQLTYILPRLKGLGDVLSRLGGGIGTRGPGETMLETDRRHIRNKIKKIKSDLKKVKRHRENLRKNRNFPRFALVGYTNAGKTTLINMLASSSKTLFAEDRLFATLDSFSRKIFLGYCEFKPFYGILSDTIGFIRNLPAALLAAFHSTLEEICHTDAVIIVLDASSNQVDAEYQVVLNELEKLKIHEKPIILFCNKSDLISTEKVSELKHKLPNGIWGSALDKKGVQDLREKMFEMAFKIKKSITQDASLNSKNDYSL